MRRGDSPDDNYDISTFSSKFELHESNYNAGEIGILYNGFAEELGGLFDEIGEAFTFVDTNASAEELKDYALVIIPSGGLYGIDSSSALKSKLEQYVKDGGTLIVFSQQHGYDFNAIPGKLNGYGWSEDQSCQHHSTGIADYHVVLSGQDSETLSINVDGYFTVYPRDSTILLTRLKNGMPAMLMYNYGNGKVIAIAAYTDWAYAHHQLTQDGKNLIRDLISWARSPQELPEFKPSEVIGFPVQVRNYTDLDAEKIIFEVVGPDKKFSDTIEVNIPVPAGEMRVIDFLYDKSLSKLGIYHLNCILANEDYGEIQRIDDIKKFAISKFASSEGGFVYRGAELSLWITTAGEEFPKGSEVTAIYHIRNDGDTAKKVSCRYGYLHKYDQYREILVAAHSETAFSYTTKVYKSGRFEARYQEEGGREQYAFKGIHVYRPTVKVRVETDRKEYKRGDLVSITLDLRNTQRIKHEISAFIRVLDPENKIPDLVEKNNRLDIAQAKPKEGK